MQITLANLKIAGDALLADIERTRTEPDYDPVVPQPLQADLYFAITDAIHGVSDNGDPERLEVALELEGELDGAMTDLCNESDAWPLADPGESCRELHPESFLKPLGPRGRRLGKPGLMM